MKNIINLILVTFISFNAIANPTATDSAKVANYLNHQLAYSQVRVSCQMLDSISEAELFCTKMKFPTGDGGYLPTEYYLLKTNGNFTSVSDDYELICTPEFLASLKTNFRLSDEESALKFQEILDVVNSQNSMNSDRLIAKMNDDWYFIRSEFFGKYDFYLVKTNTHGKVLSIEYKRDQQNISLPDDIIESDSHRAEWGYNIPKTSSEDSTYLRNYFDKQTNFHFEFTEQKSRLTEKISSASFYQAKIVFTNGNYSSATVFSLIKSNHQILHANGAKDLLKDAIFFESLNKDFTIKTEDDALTFEEALDVIAPLGTFDLEDKEHLLIDGKWYFVRSESFGDKAAFVIETDQLGKIKSFTYDLKAIKAN